MTTTALWQAFKDLTRAAIFAIFTTQGNDFGMGLPILNAVYGPGHPFLDYLYVMSLISLTVTTPAGFVFMEWNKKAQLMMDQLILHREVNRRIGRENLPIKIWSPFDSVGPGTENSI